MARPIVKYLCDFKCGKKASASKGLVESHEEKCWKNPTNKTCKTCKNEIYIIDGDDYREWIVRGCKLNALDSMFVDILELLQGTNKMHVRPVAHCLYHNAGADENTVNYAQNLAMEISTHTGYYFQIDWKRVSKEESING